MATLATRPIVVGAYTSALLTLCTTQIPVHAYTEYDVWVGSDRITSMNQNDVRGDGTIRFEPTTSTLFLKDATVSDQSDRDEDSLDNSSVIYSRLKDTTIDIQGTNVLVLEPKPATELAAGIMHQGEGLLSFVGDGSLTLTTTHPEQTTASRHGITSFGKTILAGPSVTIRPGKDEAGWSIGINSFVGVDTTNGALNIHTTRSGFGVGASNGPVNFTGGDVTIRAESHESDILPTAVGVHAAEMITLERGQVTIEADTRAFSNTVTNEGTGTVMVNTQPTADGAMRWDQVTPLGGGPVEWKFVKFTPHEPLTTVPQEAKKPLTPLEERRENGAALVFMLLAGIACVLAIFALLLRISRRTH